MDLVHIFAQIAFLKYCTTIVVANAVAEKVNKRLKWGLV